MEDIRQVLGQLRGPVYSSTYRLHPRQHRRRVGWAAALRAQIPRSAACVSQGYTRNGRATATAIKALIQRQQQAERQHYMLCVAINTASRREPALQRREQPHPTVSASRDPWPRRATQPPRCRGAEPSCPSTPCNSCTARVDNAACSSVALSCNAGSFSCCVPGRANARVRASGCGSGNAAKG